MANCCVNGLNQVFCNAFNKYYNTLYTNGEISKEETNNLLIIDYIRQCLSDDRYNSYYSILLKALRCIANNSCLLDTSWLYDRSIVPKVTNLFVTVLTKLAFIETDPIFSASPAATITDEDINNWNNPSASGALIVTITLDGNYSADKTFADMLTAWNGGLDVIVYYSDAIYQVSWIDDGGAWFFRTDKTNAGPYIDYFAVDGTDDSWTKNTYNLLTRLTFDNNPTQGSNNPVKSSGIYNLCPIIEDNRTSNTQAVIGTAPFSSLADGQRIILSKLKYPLVQAPTLKLTLSNGSETNAIPMYCDYQGGIVLKTNWGGLIHTGASIQLIYELNNNRWVLVGTLDSNTTYALATQANIDAGTSTSANVISPKLLHDNAYIVEETYSSGSLKANKMYDFGTVSSALTIPTLDATNDLVSNALNFYALRFIAGADNLSITFPTGVIVDDEPTINTDDYVEIMINLYVENSTNHFYASIKVWRAQ